jgi:Uma2 family endonuclease
MQAEVRERRFTAEEYLRMAEAGILGEDDRVELLDGRIVEMSPQGDAHVASVERATQALVLAYAGSGYAVRVQSTHRAGPRSMPEPDLAVVVAGTDRVLDVSESVLVVEVADTALATDRTAKRQLYAEAGAPRYWIVEIPERQVRVLEEPEGGDYVSERVIGQDGVLALPVVGTAVAVADILAPR